ncbi:hypothetical protein OH799_14090 [Nocardia sp. NBC_00881]|uniref:hypothetical protein n=1 Tax=Nocardia sp. NBC_00881 TaxID=2975995 RepID=UPI003870957D|nr:hypothetical protein OH799_14090 [Nocardia sp. NBC_00881]
MINPSNSELVTWPSWSLNQVEGQPGGALAPATTAAPDEIAIINGLVYQDKYGDLNGCIKVGPMDITVENHTSNRTAYIYLTAVHTPKGFRSMDSAGGHPIKRR